MFYPFECGLEARQQADEDEMVGLDQFERVVIKLRNVLEHHDQRENELLYPVLHEQLDQETTTQLATRMLQAIPGQDES